MERASARKGSGPSYAQLVERNWGFLSPEGQSRINDVRVLLAGCGLGSNLAVLAARTGFSRFLLYDGDQVEASNLNRQAFRAEHIGQSKAQATADLIREINPEADVTFVPTFLTAADAAEAVRQCDIVVNMVDPGPALQALFDAARMQGKALLFPLNVGFGGVLLIFGPESPSLMDLLGTHDGSTLFLDILLRLAPVLPTYLRQYLWIADEVAQKQVPPPQLAIAANQTASLLVTAMVKIANGQDVPYVPNVAFSDSWEPHTAVWPTGQAPISPVENP